MREPVSRNPNFKNKNKHEQTTIDILNIINKRKKNLARKFSLFSSRLKQNLNIIR